MVGARCFAIKEDHLDTVKLLANNGANLNKIDNTGCTV